MTRCSGCPRACNVDRSISPGFCGVTDDFRLARAGLHHWEEPCISGTSGSGAVFFSGCNMRCIFAKIKKFHGAVQAKPYLPAA